MAPRTAPANPAQKPPLPKGPVSMPISEEDANKFNKQVLAEVDRLEAMERNAPEF